MTGWRRRWATKPPTSAAPIVNARSIRRLRFSMLAHAPGAGFVPLYTTAGGIVGAGPRACPIRDAQYEQGRHGGLPLPNQNQKWLPKAIVLGVDWCYTLDTSFGSCLNAATLRAGSRRSPLRPGLPSND